MKNPWFVFLFFLSFTAFSQRAPEKVAGLPTNELYDLHVDKKGYLWIAHGLGISRYDGLNFTTYAHPAQINLRITDIIEDPQGRIWFHNFSGQVFYIENGKIHLLESYDFRNENQNPKMVLCGNELLITSYKGLFVCNTENFNTRFLPFEQADPTALVSIAVWQNKAFLYNNHNWYSYNNGSLQKTTLLSSYNLPKEDFIALQPSALNDTLFLTANPSGVLYKLKPEKAGLRMLGKKEYHDFINAVSVDEKAWVHTRNRSMDLQDGNVLNSFDLSDVVAGKEGNTWYGSRREGLLVSYRPSFWQQINFKIEKDDYIRSLNANAGYFFAGTQKGTLYRFATDAAKADWKQELFNGLGSIDFIRYINNDLFIVGSSTDTYIVDARKKKIVITLPIKAILDVDFNGRSFYIATASGLYVVPYLHSGIDKTFWLQQIKQRFPFFKWGDTIASAYLLWPQRTLSVRFDSLNKQVYAATKNGLFEVNKQGVQPYRIDGREIFATAVAFKTSRLYVSTVNDGLWIVEGKTAQHFTTANALASNTIIRIKLTEDHLWLFEKNGIQVLNIHTKKILENLDLPDLNGANVLDVAERGDVGYLTTSGGVYKIPLNLTAKKTQLNGYLDYVIINERDTLFNPNAALLHQQNDVQFYFSSPAFYDPDAVSFRYRLRGAESDWRVTNTGERMIRYSALAPGEYTFEVFALGSNGVQQEEIIDFPFTIEKPWWRTWWFILLLNGALVASIFFLIQNRINQKLRLELMRRSISNDLHDDIGATLSSVNFYIDMAQTEKQNAEYLQHIKENVAHVINNLDDLVWSINPKNDTTEQALHRMKEYAVPLLKAAQIQCHFDYDPKLLNLKLDLLTKRHLYLLFKEMVNNVAKHADCRNCIIHLSCQHGELSLSVEDDGQGFDPAQAAKGRNGLTSMQDRAQKLKGNLKIVSAAKRGSRVAVTIPV